MNTLEEVLAVRLEEIKSDSVKFLCHFTILELYVFTRKLHRYIETNAIKKVLFIAREGVLLRRLYEFYIGYADIKSTVQIETVYISRQSCTSALFPDYIDSLQIDRATLLVDIGWGGTIEKVIEKYVEDIHFFYLGTDERYYKDLNNYSMVSRVSLKKLAVIKSSIPIYEFVLTPVDLGTTISYQYVSHGEILPVVSSTLVSHHPTEATLITQVQAEISKLIPVIHDCLADTNLDNQIIEMSRNNLIYLKTIFVPQSLEKVNFEMGEYVVPLIANPLSSFTLFLRNIRMGSWLQGSLSAFCNVKSIRIANFLFYLKVRWNILLRNKI